MFGCRSLGPLLAALLLSGATGCGTTSGNGETEGSGGTDTDGQTGDVEVVIDDRGIPHIYAKTDAGAFYGAGYQQAADRLLQMDQTRRRAYGTLSEIHGQSTLEDDELARTFDWPGWGQRHADKMEAENQEVWQLLVAWTAGVNKRLEEIEAGDAPLPHGFGPNELDYAPTPWEPKDVLVIATMTGFGNDLSFDREIFAALAVQYFPDAMASVELFKQARPAWTLPPESLPLLKEDAPRSQPGAPTTIVPSLPPRPDVDLSRITSGSFSKLRALSRLKTMGSNSAVVDGRHTDNGKPMVAGDPHLGFDVPGMFYALHINSADGGGNFNAAGFSFVGVPGVSVGHTQKLVWTPTTAFGDVMDVWSVISIDDNTISAGGSPVTLEKREEIITVRDPGKPAGEGTQKSYIIEDAPGYGVLLPPDFVPIPVGAHDRLLLNWTGFRANAFTGLLDFNKVQSVDDYEVAVDAFGGNFNFVAADASNITYRVGVKVPVRDLSGGRTPWFVLDGEDAGSFWTEARLPPEQLPSSRAPDRGWIATANNDPFGFTADGVLDNDPWYFGAFYAPGWRAGRALEELTRLANRGGITRADMEGLSLDTHSQLGDDLLPLIETAWANVDTDPALAEFSGRADLQTLVDTLLSWDRNMKRDSAGALVLHAYAQLLTRQVLEDEMSFLFYEAMNLQPVFILKMASMAARGEYPMSDALLQEGRDYLMLAALAETADWLTTRFGSVDPAGYTFADAVQATFADATGTGVDRGKFATDGGESTVNVKAETTFFNNQGAVEQNFESGYGSIFRTVTAFADDGTPELHFTMPLGNVAEPTSPHFQDMHEGWIEGNYTKMLYRRDEIDAATESVYWLDLPPELGGE